MRNKPSKSFPSLLLGLAGGVVVVLCVVGILLINLKPEASSPKDNASSEDGSETEMTINSDERGIKTIQDVPYGPEMVLIPGGSFIYRYTENTIESFYLGKYEITVEQFRFFIKETGYKTNADRKGSKFKWDAPEFLQDDNHPVVYISWYDAKEYCNWLSSKTGNEYRLPTAKEWKYACRARTNTEYFWGDELLEGKGYINGPGEIVKEKGNSLNGKALYFPFLDGYKFTSPVGSFKPNQFDLYDIQGNVSEWCEDSRHFDVYSRPVPNIPTNLRAVCGGSWYIIDENEYLSSFRRYHREDHYGTSLRYFSRFANLGFRVARDIEKKDK